MTEKRIPKYREAARKEQDGLCYYCLCEMADVDSGEETACTADHLIPRMLGGKSVRANIVACCYRCNQIKDSSPAFAPKPSGKRHDRNRRNDEASIHRQERKAASRLSMWRQSVGA
jgi:5-methylcytosine-specific restriction endonuclease McrA